MVDLGQLSQGITAVTVRNKEEELHRGYTHGNDLSDWHDMTGGEVTIRVDRKEKRTASDFKTYSRSVTKRIGELVSLGKQRKIRKSPKGGGNFSGGDKFRIRASQHSTRATYEGVTQSS